MLLTSAPESFRILNILIILAICDLGSSCKDVFGLAYPAAGCCPGFGFLFVLCADGWLRPAITIKMKERLGLNLDK